MVDLAKDLLKENHPGETRKIVETGIGYVGGVAQLYFFLRIIEEAVKEVGAENFNGQAVYDAVENFQTTFVDFPKWSFLPERPYPHEDVILYVVQAAQD